MLLAHTTSPPSAEGTISRAFADYALALDGRALPEEVRRKAALAAARLAGLSHAATVDALGFAGNLGAGLNAWPWSGGTEIYFHAGNAARGEALVDDLAALDDIRPLTAELGV